MRTVLTATTVVAAMLGFGQAALAQTFHVGDHVHIGNGDTTGVVVEVGQQLPDGGTFIRIHGDTSGLPANMGITYDSAVSGITVTQAGPAAAPGAPVAAPATTAFPNKGQPTTFQVGDRVHIGIGDKTGTVIEIQGPLVDSGTMIRIHLDDLPTPANVGIVYDSYVSQITVTGHGAAPAAGQPAGQPAAAQPAPAQQPGAQPPAAQKPVAQKPAAQPAKPPAAPAAAPAGPANQAAGTAGSCQAAIKSPYAADGADQTVTVNFQTFTMGAQHSYTATYANDFNGVGHTVQSTPIHAQYTVLTHYADPNAPDELKTFDAMFECYVSAAGGGLVAEMKSQQPSPPLQYIPKK